jgi:hypothetical protein
MGCGCKGKKPAQPVVVAPPPNINLSSVATTQTPPQIAPTGNNPS